jgi:hypothetical protein
MSSKAFFHFWSFCRPFGRKNPSRRKARWKKNTHAELGNATNPDPTAAAVGQRGLDSCRLAWRRITLTEPSMARFALSPPFCGAIHSDVGEKSRPGAPAWRQISVDANFRDSEIHHNRLARADPQSSLMSTGRQALARKALTAVSAFA